MEKAKEIRNKIKEIEELKYKLEQELWDLQKENKVKPKYGNREIYIDTDRKNYKGEELGESIRISDFLLNEHEKDEHLKVFGSVNGSWEKRRNSVSYFRNEYGILQHNGGGWVLLNDGIPCSDEEWEDLKAGNIPDKFAKNI